MSDEQGHVSLHDPYSFIYQCVICTVAIAASINRASVCVRTHMYNVTLRHSLSDGQRKTANDNYTTNTSRPRHCVTPTMQTLRRLRRNGRVEGRRTATGS